MCPSTPATVQYSFTGAASASSSSDSISACRRLRCRVFASMYPRSCAMARPYTRRQSRLGKFLDELEQVALEVADMRNPNPPPGLIVARVTAVLEEVARLGHSRSPRR